MLEEAGSCMGVPLSAKKKKKSLLFGYKCFLSS